MTANIRPFGILPTDEEDDCIRLSGGGLSAQVLTYGATVQDLRLDGDPQPLVLGAPAPAPNLGPMKCFGAFVGRFANRIANGRFGLAGRTYEVPRN